MIHNASPQRLASPKALDRVVPTLLLLKKVDYQSLFSLGSLPLSLMLCLTVLLSGKEENYINFWILRLQEELFNSLSETTTYPRCQRAGVASILYLSESSFLGIFVEKGNIFWTGQFLPKEGVFLSQNIKTGPVKEKLQKLEGSRQYRVMYKMSITGRILWQPMGLYRFRFQRPIRGPGLRQPPLGKLP